MGKEHLDAISVLSVDKSNSLQTAHYLSSNTSDLVTQWDFHISCHFSQALVAADANSGAGSLLVRVTLRPAVNALFATAAIGTETTELTHRAGAFGSELIRCGYRHEASIDCLAASLPAAGLSAVALGPGHVARLVKVGRAPAGAELSRGDGHVASVAEHVLSVVNALVDGEVGVE